MPTLFISYKRGTSAVAALMEKLQAAHYRLWFDRDEIHLGDSDWQARIDQGLALCDGVILNITPAACASEPVRYEIRKARELGKLIFPIILEQITDYDAAIHDLGLAEKQHIEDFTDVTRWNEQIQRLLHDLEAQGLTISPYERRQQRDRNNPKYGLYQTYLKQLAERIGMINLAQINPDQPQTVYLENVYVDSPAELSINVQMKNWHVIDWWLNQTPPFSYFTGSQGQKDGLSHIRPQELGYESAPFETLIGKFDEEAENDRKEMEQAILDRKNGKDVLSYKLTPNRLNYDLIENAICLHLNHLAAARNRLVILGAPGSGKSTFVKYLALCLAGSGIDGWERKARIEALDNWSHDALTPVYIELRHFVASKYFPEDMTASVTANHLWSYIQYELLREKLQKFAGDLLYDLDNGHSVLILDGLDEVPYPEGKLKARQQQLIGLAQSINTRFANSRVIVTSRPYAYEGWALPGFSTATIRAFESNHRVDLASRLYLAVGLDETDSRTKANALDSQLQQIDPELKDRPLFVTLMASIYLKGDNQGLPTRRGTLYLESIMLLLNRWTQSKKGVPSLVEILNDQSLHNLYMRLASLAYDVHSNYGEQPGTSEIDESLLYKHLKPLGRKVAAELIPYLSENAGVLVSPGQNNEKTIFTFAHRTFQEYLAGVYLVSLCEEQDSFKLIADHIISKPDVWRMPCTLAGDVLADTDRRGDLWNLLDDLLEDIPDDITTSDPRWSKVWLGSMILQEQKLMNGIKLRRSEKVVSDQLLKWTLKAVELGVMRPVQRASCGRALDLLGDPRLGVGLRLDGLPDIAWCDMPAGTFLIGFGYDKKEQIIAHDFKIAKYPITYQQFQTFVISGEYEDTRWWIGIPKEYQGDVIGAQSNVYNNHPRESVSWYQAVAFTRWLTVKYKTAELIANDVEIRLPTEQEWEYAAQETEEQRYYFFNNFDMAKGNTEETRIRQSTAVGIFPNGISSHKVLDMSGNVFEWCLNDYWRPKIIDGYGNGESKVVRGGSFRDNSYMGDASSRDSGNPAYGHSNYGFRVVLSSMSNQSLEPV